MTKQRLTRSFTLMAALALCAVLAAPTHADVEKGTGEVGIDIGYTDFDSDVGSTGMRFAFRGGYFFTDVIGLEGMLSYTSASEESETSPELYTAYVNAVVNFRHKRNLVPYFALGIGAAQMDIGPVDDSGPTAQALGGARFYGQKGKFGFRLEGGLQWVDTFDESTANWNMSFGFTWTVGGPHPHYVPDPRYN